MTDRAGSTPADWALRAADRAPSVERSRQRSAQRAQQVVAAAKRLVADRGSSFTMMELVKEAGLAVHTLYKHFPSKDHVLLAVLEEMIADAVHSLEQQADLLPHPLERLELLVMGILTRQERGESELRSSRFMASERWRLAAEYPIELRQATRPVEEFVERQLRLSAAEGTLHPADPASAAWLTTQLLIAVFHHHAFNPTEGLAEVARQTWEFCLVAWGGPRADARAAPVVA